MRRILPSIHPFLEIQDLRRILPVRNYHQVMTYDTPVILEISK